MLNVHVPRFLANFLMEDCEEVLWWVCLSGVFGLFRQCFGCGVFCIVLDLVCLYPRNFYHVTIANAYGFSGLCDLTTDTVWMAKSATERKKKD